VTDESNSNDTSLPLPALERIDKVCLQFEGAWKKGGKPCIEDYLGEAQGPERRELLRQLLLLDLDYRRQQADQPTEEEYRARFPDDGELVADVFREFSVRAASSPPPGTKVRYFGDYELLEELGHGGMGVVYKARQMSLNRIVAVKMIHPARLISQVAVRRLRAEAEVAASLQHPSIVAVHEVGEHEGQHYFAMDYVEGNSLAEIVRENPLPAKHAAEYVQRIAEAVHYAHQQGTLHRDLKPSNVLIDAHDQPQLTDFGLAKRLEGDSELTSTKEILGTPSYMSPEQAEGNHERIGAASDGYSLGAILYELLTGRPVFRGATPVDTLRLVIDTEPVSPCLLNPKVPRDLETIVLKCLEKHPHKRYGSADALADDLGRFLRREPIEARPINRMQRLWRWCRRKPVLAVVCTIALIATFATLIGLAVSVVSLGRLWRAERALRAASDRQAATFFFERSRARCRPEDPARGMLWLARSLQEAAKVDDPELETSVRLQLAAWSRDLPRLDSIGSCPAGATAHAILSPDGALLAIGVDDGPCETYLWNFANAETMPHRVPGLPLAFLPDGKTLLSTVIKDPEGVVSSGWRFTVVSFNSEPGWYPTDGSQFLQLNDIDSGQAMGPPFELTPPSWCVMSPDGKSVCIVTYDLDMMASRFDKPSFEALGPMAGYTTRLVEVGTWKALGSHSMEPAIPLGFAEDGRTLAMAKMAGANNVVFLVDVASGETIGTPVTIRRRHDQDLLFVFILHVHQKLCLSPDARTLAMLDGDDHGDWHWVVLADLHTGEMTEPQGRAPGWGKNVAFGPNGDTLAVASGDNVRLWDVRSWEPLVLPLPDNFIGLLGFVPSRSGLLTVQRNGGLNLLGVVNNSDLVEARSWRLGPTAAGLHHIRLATDRLHHAVFSPDTKTVLLSYGSHWMLYQRSTEKARPLCSASHLAESWAFSRDGKRLVRWFRDEGRVAVWDVAASTLMYTLAVDGIIAEAAFTPDPTRLVIARSGDEAQVWDTVTGTPAGPPSKFGHDAEAIAVSPDGTKFLAGGSDVGYGGDPRGPRRVGQLWDAATGEPLGRPLGYLEAINAVAFSRDGSTVLTSSEDKTVRFWDASTGEAVGPVLEHQGEVREASFSPNGRLVLTQSCYDFSDQDATEARLWDMRSGSPVGPPLRPKGHILDVAFSPEGKAVLAVTDNNVIFRWDIAPLQGTPEQILLWTQVMTGMELDSLGRVQVLDAPTWLQRRKRLEQLGGPP